VITKKRIGLILGNSFVRIKSENVFYIGLRLKKRTRWSGNRGLRLVPYGGSKPKDWPSGSGYLLLCTVSANRVILT